MILSDAVRRAAMSGSIRRAAMLTLALLMAPAAGPAPAAAQTAPPASPPAATPPPAVAPPPTAAPATAPAPAAAPATWQKQEGPGGVFTIEMPGKPGYKLEQAKSGGGTAFGYHSYSLDHDGRAFVVQTATYPADVDVKNPKANLTKALDASGKHLQAKKWSKLTWTKHQGATAVEATGLMSDKLEFPAISSCSRATRCIRSAMPGRPARCARPTPTAFSNRCA